MRLSGIDLNLLTTLDALLAEQNVTRAAKRLGISQPAVSHSLKRLRDLLDDELLVRGKVGMIATPRALELRAPLRIALDAAEVVLRAAPGFDPATADRTFVMLMADQESFLLLPLLAERLAREAPGIRIDVRPPPNDVIGNDIELAVGVWSDVPANVMQQPLWRESFVCVLRKGSAAARGTLDRKRYLAASHVVVATTDLLWTAPEGIARVFVDYLPLVIREAPLPVNGFTVSMRWHVRVDGDPGLAWLRGVLREIATASRRPVR